jgi:hypothetical protein
MAAVQETENLATARVTSVAAPRPAQADRSGWRRLREALRSRHYTRRTEQAYCYEWHCRLQASDSYGFMFSVVPRAIACVAVA